MSMNNAVRTYRAKSSVRFYPQDTSKLQQYILQMMAQVGGVDNTAPVKAIIAPHAAYVYSGLCAANAYKYIAPQKDVIKKVVIFGPSHKHYFKGIAVPSCNQWETPLGVVPVAVDELRNIIRENEFVSVNDLAHEHEYSLDVHVPFLQVLLDNFVLLPFAVGDATVEDVSRLILSLSEDPDILIIISTDLSHFLSDDDARVKDSNTAKLIDSSRSKGLDETCVCGHIAVSALLDCAQKRHVDIKRMEICNSSDAIGKAGTVVGYGSWVFVKRNLNSDERIIRKHGDMLISTATSAIKRRLDTGSSPKIDLGKVPDALHSLRSTFVTIELNGKIRGSMGNMSASRSLIEDVVENAIGAAVDDGRFEPLQEPDFNGMMITVSLLSPMVRMSFSDEQELLDQLVPHYHGLLIQDKFLRKKKSDRAVFLPQVWNAVPEPKQFLEQLKAKAGLPLNYWGEDLVAWKFSVVKTTGFMKRYKLD